MSLPKKRCFIFCRWTEGENAGDVLITEGGVNPMDPESFNALARRAMEQAFLWFGMGRHMYGGPRRLPPPNAAALKIGTPAGLVWDWAITDEAKLTQFSRWVTELLGKEAAKGAPCKTGLMWS